ncbi:MAG TPA: DUF4013 domain-containing protein [Flexilinea sp.]|nr:DUF4013 domain-containing protein [Flexilinea sp.]
MDFTRAITYVFREEKWWKKLLITGLISVIPVVGLIYLIGWISEVVLRVKWGDYSILPEKPSWSFLKEGIKLFLTSLIYIIPYLIISLFIRFISWGWSLIFSGVIEKFGVGFFGFLNDAVALVYFFIFLYIIPAVLYLYLDHKNVRDTLNFKRVYQMIKNDSKTFLSLLISIILAIIIASIGVSLFYIGVIFTIPFAAAFYAHLLGQVSRGY